MIRVEVFRYGNPACKIAAMKVLRAATGYGLAEAAGFLGRLDWDGEQFSVEFTGVGEAKIFVQQLCAFDYGCKMIGSDEPAGEKTKGRI